MDRIESISIFVAVAEQESFAGAARMLHRTPASVTRAVADLEEHLHARLLNRTTRSVSLTEAGQRYLEICRRLLVEYDALRQVDTGEAEPQGVLHVTAPANFGRRHVLPLVAEFMERHPGLDVRLLLLDRVVSLVDEGLDVGVRLGQLPDSSLRATRVGQVWRGVFGSPAYLKRYGRPETPQQLAGHVAVSCVAVTDVPDRWSFSGGAVTVRPRMVVNTTDAAADAAALGIGLAYLISYQTDHLVKAGRLVEVLDGFRLPPIPIHVVQPGGRFTPTKVRLFVEEVGTGLRRRFSV